jgi:hypothetical protein
MTLVLVGMIGFYLINERRQEHAELRRAVALRDEALAERLRDDLRRGNSEQSESFLLALDAKGAELVTAVKGVFVKKLYSSEEYYRYLAERIGTAKKSVDDVTWGAVSPAGRVEAEKDAFNAYRDGVRTACGRPNLRFREIYSFPNISRVERLDETIGYGLNNYHARYYEVSADKVPPLLQFTVIDGEEVIFGTGRGVNRSKESETYLAVRSRMIAEKIGQYFAIVWDSAKPIPENGKSVVETIARLRRQSERRGRSRD